MCATILSANNFFFRGSHEFLLACTLPKWVLESVATHAIAYYGSCLREALEDLMASSKVVCNRSKSTYGISWVPVKLWCHSHGSHKYRCGFQIPNPRPHHDPLPRCHGFLRCNDVTIKYTKFQNFFPTLFSFFINFSYFHVIQLSKKR